MTKPDIQIKKSYIKKKHRGSVVATGCVEGPLFFFLRKERRGEKREKRKEELRGGTGMKIKELTLVSFLGTVRFDVEDKFGQQMCDDDGDGDGDTP
jgi:hypothetical protein